MPKNRVVDCLCEMVDLVPTVLELAHIPEHFPHNGMSLLHVMHSDVAHKEFVFSEGGFLTSEEPWLESAAFPYDLKGNLQHEDTKLVGKAISIRNKDYTYIYRLYEAAELYDRHEDSNELHNLAAEPKYAAIVAMFKETMTKWLVETSDFLPWKKDPRRPPIKLDSPLAQAYLRTTQNKN